MILFLGIPNPRERKLLQIPSDFYRRSNIEEDFLFPQFSPYDKNPRETANNFEFLNNKASVF
jgi:hypothetical protein